jgi:rubredoxin
MNALLEFAKIIKATAENGANPPTHRLTWIVEMADAVLQEAVPAGMECPHCGEWRDDLLHIAVGGVICQTCGMLYALNEGEPTSQYADSRDAAG